MEGQREHIQRIGREVLWGDTWHVEGKNAADTRILESERQQQYSLVKRVDRCLQRSNSLLILHLLLRSSQTRSQYGCQSSTAVQTHTVGPTGRCHFQRQPRA